MFCLRNKKNDFQLGTDLEARMFLPRFPGNIRLGILCEVATAGFIRVREVSGKFKFFQGQGIVREFYVVSVKNGYLLKCQGNVREFYKFQGIL